MACKQRRLALQFTSFAPFRTDALHAVYGSPTWKLVTVNLARPSNLNVDALLHGIVFGDGTRHRPSFGSSRKSFCHIYLCNDPNGSDSRKLARLFHARGFKAVIRDDMQQVRFYGLRSHWKATPDVNATPEYLRGLLRLSLQPTATLRRAHRSQRSPRRIVARFASLHRVAPRAGLAMSTSIGTRRSQSTFGPTEAFSVGIPASTLDPDFFALPENSADCAQPNS